MKKLVYIFLIVLVMCLSGCGVKKDGTNQNETKQEIQYTVNFVEPESTKKQDENANKTYEIELDGKKHTLQYSTTKKTLPVLPYIHIYDGEDVAIDVNSETGEVAIINQYTRQEGDIVLTEDSIKEKADNIARTYVDIEDFVCEGGVRTYENNEPYIYNYVYKKYHEELIITNWIEIEIDKYGNTKLITLYSIWCNETDKGLEKIDKDTIEKMDESVIKNAIERTKGTADFKVNRREAIEVDGKTRLLYFVDAYNDEGDYASFSWFYEVVWE